MNALPLEGIKVLDMSTVLAAPVTATFLGDFGAEVVKIEEPVRGDVTRASPSGRRSLQWAQEGRNKKSVCIDLRKPRGQALARELVREFDVTLTNYRPPTLEKWGLDPASLQRANPSGIHVFITGYGLDGPNRDRGAFDRIASAYSGLTYVSGEPDRQPVRSGYAVIDYMSAYLAAFGTVTALYHRDHNGGQGQVIDLALYEAGFRASEDALLAYSHSGQVRERLGNRNPQMVPASDFRTKDDRWISVHAGTDTLFPRLAQVMGMPKLIQNDRFATRAARIENQEDLYEVISDWMSTVSADEAVSVLNDAGIPASPVMSVADIASDPHYLQRGTFVEVEDPEFGKLLMAAPIPRLSDTPGKIRSLGPNLGEHTDSVLSEMLGLRVPELTELRSTGVIS